MAFELGVLVFVGGEVGGLEPLSLNGRDIIAAYLLLE
jgi:hypothetical protein